MDVWFHNENPYPFVPQEVLDRADSVRASLPNKYCDPHIAADLFEEVFDEFMLCDDQGINVVAIEHHAGINSLFGANPLILGILARQTRKARILSLGTLISLRPDPVRVAEEYATADVISRGRLEIGYVKSGGSEMASNNANPVNNIERYWEAIDLVTKALTHQDGAVQLGGQALHAPARQHLAAPVAAAASAGCGRPPAIPRRRARWAGGGWSTCWSCAARRGRSAPGPPIARRGWRPGCPRSAPTTSPMRRSSMSATRTRRASGLAASCCGSSTPASRRRPSMRGFSRGGAAALRAAGLPHRTQAVPGPTGRLAATGAASGGKTVASASQNAATLMGMTAEQAMQAGILFAGSPDTVYQQIMDFYDKVGGFGHLVMIGRSGFMTHAEAEKGIKLFAREVLPRLKEIAPVTVG